MHDLVDTTTMHFKTGLLSHVVLESRLPKIADFILHEADGSLYLRLKRGAQDVFGLGLFRMDILH